MRWIKNILVLVVLLTVLACKKEARASEYPSLIEAGEFAEAQWDPRVVVVDFRKKEDYLKEHIPGAIQIWRTDIESSAYPYAGMMASKEQMESLFSRLGIHPEDHLVVYDDRGSCDAARLWWILQYYGFNQVSLLDGGLKAWKGTSGVLTTQLPQRSQSEFVFKGEPHPQMLIEKEELLSGLERGWILLDTRTHNEYSGKRLKRGAVAAGRIKGSHWVDWSEAIDYHGEHQFKDIDELREIYRKFIPSMEDTVVTYCHSGVRSAHTTFVLSELLGYPHIKNYDGSWTEWSRQKGFPVEKDSITVILQ